MTQFFVLFLAAAGYFLFLGITLSRMKGRTSIPLVGICVLLIYGCAVGMLVVLGEYLGEIGFVLYALGFVILILYCLYGIYRRLALDTGGERATIHSQILLLFLAYLLAVLYVTIFIRDGNHSHKIQMELLHWTSDALDRETPEHILLNVVMFLPLGGLYTMLWKTRKNPLSSGTLFGLAVTLFIETVQLISHRGTCDIDDILANTLGAALGTLSVLIMRKVRKRNESTDV